ncbi:aminotransferase class I/II-fold pyridoxal phosphate-dependent enzyme [Actinoplanes sp. NPDC051859]|uniref:aminotransferase class I/II-fold pyridoxal phosphate-dependent enzyme n=1 Tax=Actinoplanes sp. NPDC051859 TaxID=3363909 RepID=UPI0037A5BF74
MPAAVLGRWLAGDRILLAGTATAEWTATLPQPGRTIATWTPGAPGPDGDTRSPAAQGSDRAALSTDAAGQDFDAAVCAGWSWTGGPASHRRFLAGIRRRVCPGGVLVVDQPAAPDDFDPLTGRAGVVRCYHPTELAELVRAAGFRVEHVELTSPGAGGGPPGMMILARAVPSPPSTLAVTGWGEDAGDVWLDLRYADDETELLDPPPAAAWAGLAATAEEVAGHYPVDDPYGSVRGAPVVSRYFGREVTPDQLVFGAGVTALLHDLSGLADSGPVLAPVDTHPDLSAWATMRGSDIEIVPGRASVAALRAAISRYQPALVHLDRPAFDASVFALDDILRIAQAAAEVGAALVVDESPAAYLGPADSAATVVGQADNLVVVRGFTKAYSWGGLRAGYAVCSPGIATRVRELATPMSIGELALRAALEVLAAGDPLAAVRERLRRVKPPFVALLTKAGLAVEPGHPDIPWVVVANPDGAVQRELASRGIRGLLPAPAPVPVPPESGQLHLTVPQSDRRITLFEALFSAVGEDVSR